ncbi:hypothetical protein Dsin_003613 [Dipteronia sinensis]|uniref:Uncharacterized protein n=1 Tax=Dipteronia sinensis TaxID=43782 RepID=A0AAE0B9F7_9ROSI|nr:hypothetical protein Dsin_003613 [Dipteronia sinensis]
MIIRTFPLKPVLIQDRRSRVHQKQLRICISMGLSVVLSTAILALAENGDLQLIHDKWLLESSCTLENAALELDLLHITTNKLLGPLSYMWDRLLHCPLHILYADNVPITHR